MADSAGCRSLTEWRRAPWSSGLRRSKQVALGTCIKAHTQTTSDSPAVAACKAEYLKLGGNAFTAKYGKDALGQCVKLKVSLATANSLVASCKASSGSSRDAFKACLIAGLQPRRR